MNKETVLDCTYEQMKAFFRFEVLFSDLSREEAEKVVLKNRVFISFDDILDALERMRKNRTGILTINEEWLVPLLMLGDQIGLARLLGAEKMADADLEHAYLAVPIHKKDALRFVFSALKVQAETADGSDEVQSIDAWLEMLRNASFNDQHPMRQWHLNEMQKQRYIENAYDEDLIDIMTADEKTLFQKCLQEECEAGSLDAWRIKAYCLAGGNTLYACDYEAAADILAALLEEDGDPYDANLLGKILYKGLIEGEDPDYEEAYRYLSTAAFCGVSEAMCYCADMLLKGQGVPVNVRAACELVQRAYSQTKELFINGDFACCFAEAAMRMGDYERYGIGVNADGMLACSYYLEAETAVSMRMQTGSDKDDDALWQMIGQRCRECEEALGDKVRQRIYKAEEPYLIDRLLSNGHELKMQVKRVNRQTYLVFSRSDEGLMLVTCEELGYSRLHRQVAVEAVNMKNGMWIGGRSICFNQAAYDAETGTTVFMNAGRETGRIVCSSFIFTDPRRPGWRQEPLISFAAAVFPGERKEYDFINTIPGLKKGDHILVDTKYGPEEAVFVREYKARMSEMPVRKYQKVLQKTNAYLYA